MKANHHPKGSPEAPIAPLRSTPRRRAAAAAGALLLGLGAAGCSSSDDEDDGAPFLVLSTGQAIATGTSPLAADDDWLAYLVSEAAQGGQDLNGDGDTNDGVAVRFDTDDGTAEVLAVAATDLAFARRTLFLTVLEAQDGTDWNSDGDMNDRVLLFNTPASGMVTYLDDLRTDTQVIAIGSAVIYATPDAPTMELESNLRLAEVGATGAAPGTPAMITTGTDPNMDGISFTVNGRAEDIVFLSADETVDGNLNGDGDSTDEAIFAVMDAGAVTPTAVVTGVGVDLSSVPGVAMTPGGEWLVAFLAEEAQEGVSLNDPGNLPVGWAAASCTGADADTTDNVLHWFLFSDLAMNTPPENTGLTGDSTGRAYALGNGFVGVVSNEGEQSSGNCDYNGNGEFDDDVFRWISTSGPLGTVLPETSAARLVAVDTDVPGGTGGVLGVDGLWVVQVDEAEDGREYDTDNTTDRNLVIALDPEAVNPQWNNLHGTVAAVPTTATWMAPAPGTTTEFYAAIAEETRTVVGGGDLNGDMDVNDAVPTIAGVANGTTLSFPGISVAVRADNPGIVVRNNVAFARVDESAQGGQDLNLDGDANDLLLVRFSLVNAFSPTLMGTSNGVVRPSVAFGEGVAEFGATLVDEALDGVDRNGDGDTSDTIVRYFELP